MEKVLLVLGIIKGRDWNPKEGNKTLIEAHLDTHKLSTNVFPLTSSPKFNTEVTWESGKKIIRSYKLNRVPIKVECFALDEKDKRKLLGYIILPLTSAVEGIEADSKWYKLLGGTKGTHKTAPSILLSLHLEAMTFDQYAQVNGKQLGNGVTKGLEDARMSSVLDKKKVLQGRIDMTSAQTNGSDDYAQYPQFQTQNPRFMGASNGNCVVRNEIVDEMDSDNIDEDGEVEEEELLDSEGCSDDYANDPLGMIVDAYSLNEGIEEGDNDSCSLDAEPGKRFPVVENDPGVQCSSNKKIAGNYSTRDKSSVNRSDTTEHKLSKNNSDHQDLVARASVRDLLHKISENPPSYTDEKPSCTNSLYSSLEKRIFDTSNLLDRSLKPKNKSRKVDDSAETSLIDFSHGPNRSSREEIDLSCELKERLSRCEGTTSAGFLLSQSLAGTSRTSEPQQHKESTSKNKHSAQIKLFPRLNQEEGCFYIGPREGEQEEEFTFSVSIIYAKNLKKILPREVDPSEGEGFRFCYSLLGYSIYTDPFHNLDNPEFVAEKASAKVRSSHQSLSLYFSQHCYLPVHFMNGDTCIGTCNVDIGFLIDIAKNKKTKFEDVYEICAVNNKNLAETGGSDKHKPVVAMTFEVAKTIRNDIFIPSDSNVSPLSTEAKIESVCNRLYASSSESCSEREEEIRFKSKGKTRKKRARYSLKNYLHEDACLQAERSQEREKKMLLLEAAYEVEKWKEEQQRIFMNEWADKEETLQKLLATEWSSKIKIIESELSHRLTECDKLQEKLNTGLAELSLREEKFKSKEIHVKKLEQELVLEKERIQTSKLKGSRSETENFSVKQLANKQLEVEKQKNQQLQKQVANLKEDLQNSEELLKTQTQEVIDLRRKLVLTDDLVGVTKEKEILHNKIETLQESKQYYKAQWLSLLEQLHKFHSAHKRAIDEITLDVRNTLPEPSPRHSSPLEPSSEAIKLRKLQDERKFLLGTGLYPSNHSIIRNIDKKLKELIG